MKSWIKKIFNPTIEPINKIYINSENILHNLSVLQNLQKNSSIFPVLKSNAYWHWLVQITKILKKTDVPYLVVDSFPEYQIVKKYSKKNILILWETLLHNYKKFDFFRTAFCVYNIETIRYLAKFKKNIKIHIFLDTGMHREWVNSDELINILEFLKKYPKLKIDWVLSHLHNADDEVVDSIQKQINLFKKMYHSIIDYWHNPTRKHIWNTAWLAKIDDVFFNSYRVWIWIYWYNNLSIEDKYHKILKNLKPALSINSKIISIRDIHAWDCVSYNKTRIANKDLKVWCIPFWYAEWLPKSSSNKIFFKIRNKYFTQIGSVCMNISCLKVPINISIWDGAEIVWLEWDNTIQKMSGESGLSIYEILVWLDKNTRREIL